MLKKIVIIGPESTGKSTLSRQLAEHYQTSWCAEYAREYLLEHGTDYRFEDLLIIAKGQLALEKECFAATKQQQRNLENASPAFLFIDTDQYVMKVWCEFVFNACHTWILNRIVEQKYDLYLLCNIDLPWTMDELREYPDEQPRRQLYHIYKDVLINQRVPWADISGSYEERFLKAKIAVDRLS